MFTDFAVNFLEFERIFLRQVGSSGWGNLFVNIAIRNLLFSKV